MRTRNLDTLWLDIARGTHTDLCPREQKFAERLRRDVRYWVIATEPPLPAEILRQLGRFPDISRDTAGALVEITLNDAVAKGVVRIKIAYVNGNFQRAPVSPFGGSAAWTGFLQAVLSPHPKHGWKICGHCGETYIPQRSASTFCSTNCRVGAYRAKRKQES